MHTELPQVFLFVTTRLALSVQVIPLHVCMKVCRPLERVLAPNGEPVLLLGNSTQCLDKLSMVFFRDLHVV
jgi:hypothetical protein